MKAVGRPVAQKVEAGAERIPVRRPPVQLAEEQLLVILSRDLAELPRKDAIDGRALRGGCGRGASDEGARAVDDTGLGNTGSDGKIAAADLGIEEAEQLVLLDRAAHAEARLMPDLRRIEGGVAVARIQGAIAEEPVGRAVRVVSAAARDGVDHAA